MCGKFLHSVFFLFVLSLTAGVVMAGIDYGEPDGGWAYIYNGDVAAPDLDGTWDHDNGSDSWDESEIGSGLPGGIIALSEDGVNFIRLQETGDPRDHGQSDPSNRKIFFTHDLTNEIDQPVADEILSVGGITLSFRARISTTPPLDDIHPDGGGAVTPWPAEGNGYGVHDGGKSNFTIHQEEGGDQCISFALALANDDHPDVATYMGGKDGMNMNALNGTSPSGDVDAQDPAEVANVLELDDPTQWHEFWITIEPDTSGGGTHKVHIYFNGSTTANEFHVTSGTGGDESFSYIAMGVGATPQSGAIDIDFFAYKEGIIAPVPSNPNMARALNPIPGSTVNLAGATPLAWIAGETAVEHDVYFGTVEEDVNNADISDTTGIYRGRQNLVLYPPPETLELGGTYYWRIDEVEADGATLHKGDVWSFSILDHLVIDDFEDYDSGDNQIWFAWHDGLGYGEPGIPPYFPGNGTGASVGDETTGSFTEETIVHSGRQSMPYWYDNNKEGFLNYSEATHTLTDTRDWTEQGVKALSLWFRGYPPKLGSFTEAPAGTYTMTAEGADIWGTSDEFHFAWQQLNGAGSIVARVESVQDTDPWAKAGVMIRDTLDPDSAHGMVAITPGNGVWFGRRTAAGDASDSDNQTGLTAPYWLKLERTSGGLVRALYSPDNSSWTQLGSSIPINMNIPMYIGLALTSHNSGVACEAVFTNVTSDGTGPWTNQDIGLSSNEAAKMYVSISNTNGATGTVFYDDNQNIDPNATLIDTWTEWNVDLKDFADQGVDLTDINNISIGFGDKDNPQPGGSGKMYFDDIRLYQPRYVPDKVEPLEADFNDDGIVDYRDVEIMTDDWLDGDFTRPGPLLVQYKFDEGEGTVAADSSGQGSDGTLSGTATWATEGQMGAAVSFDGGVGEVRGASPYLNGLDAISYGAWIKSNAIDTDSGFIIFANPAGNDQRGIRYDLAGGNGGGANVIKYGVATEEGSHENESAANVQTTQWQHVMVTWNSGEAASLYINGVPDTPTDEDDIIGGTTTGYTDVIVGRGGKDTDGSWDGLVDDFRVYEVALTAEEVQTVMNGGDLPVEDTYVPLESPANIYDEEPINSKIVNFKDFALLADEWLQQLVWPDW
ncbi:MAG: LamG domain-containing protein [Planctomycetota bacterium]|jgi:hypothetical protein